MRPAEVLRQHLSDTTLERGMTYLDSCLEDLYLDCGRLVQTVYLHVDDLACIAIHTEGVLAFRMLRLNRASQHRTF